MCYRQNSSAEPMGGPEAASTGLAEVVSAAGLQEQIVKLLQKTLLVPLAAVTLWLLAANVSAQSIEENIRPVGQVCLQGDSCVGTLVGEAPLAAATSAVSEPEPVAATAASTEQAAEPVASAAEPAFDAAATYQMSCFACHGTGAAGAPMPGDADAWSTRMEKGMDAVMANVINGINAMPPKGLCMNCSDGDLRSLVDYMLEQ